VETNRRPADGPVVRIAPGSHSLFSEIAELWHQREIVYLLALRDLKAKVEETALGLLWPVLQPLATVAALSVSIGRWVQSKDERVVYAVLVYAGLVPWQIFVRAINEGASSLSQNRHLISKIYFPRIALPLATVAVGVVESLLGIWFLFVVAWWNGAALRGAAMIPLLVVMYLYAVVVALFLALWLAALNARYRDVKNALPFISQILFFLAPIAYPATAIPEAWRRVYYLNPMVGVVEGFRWAALGGIEAPVEALAASAIVSLLLGVFGFAYFHRVERTLADIL
jgi:lipopolysaccharide transport system permease protein